MRWPSSVSVVSYTSITPMYYLSLGVCMCMCDSSSVYIYMIASHKPF
jgi:hypothetical protein